jgi:tetratricopeptide (TPR) repeat protein
MGINPTVWDWMGDGVVYRVAVDGREVFTHALTAEQARQGWQPARVDLGEWAGQTVRLTLITDPGPHGDGGGDWAGWGDVRVVAGDGVPWAWVRAAWEEGGITAQDLIAAGEKARKAERYEEALAWYERAAGVAPELGDPWYYVGLAREEQKRWRQALDAYRKATGIDHFHQVHLSNPYYRAARIYQWELRELEKALSAYEAAIDADDFSKIWQAADSHYKRGEILWWMDSTPSKYIAEYEEAIRINPNHVWANIKLGTAYYRDYGNVKLAEDTIQQALELSPDHKWAYFRLGEIYQQEGRIEESIAAYEQALKIDPNFERARTRLTDLDE